MTLKPCPFCGEVPWSGEVRDYWAIQCINPGCTVKPSVTKPNREMLVNHWNTRTPSTDEESGI